MSPERPSGDPPRPATSADADAVADVWLRARKASTPAIPPPVHSDEEVREHLASVIDSPAEVWVIDADDRGPIAMAVLAGGWVDGLYIDPDWTGHDLGSQLIGLLKERSAGRLDLWTFETNVGARRFYERHGFVSVGTTDGDNEEGEPDIHYRWERPTPT